jgi:SOS response regulatory protein OraA/RecX
MEIGWWGGGAPGGNEHDDENRDGDAEVAPDAGVEVPAEQSPARPVSRPIAPIAAVKPVKPVKPVQPLATRPSAAPAAPAPAAAAEAPAARDDSLATVSYLPWAAPGIDVAASSGIESTAYRRPFVAPERGFDGAGFDATGFDATGFDRDEDPVVIAEPGDWTAEYSDDDDEEEAEAEFDPAALENALIKKLARRDLSVAEAEHFLEQNGLPAEQLEEWIERNERLGYLDDVRLAENLVDQLRRRKGLGSSSIRQELGRRKINPMVISEALGESDQDDERARALELAVKRAGQLSSYDEATAERRLTGFLMRKGYGSGVVRDVVKTALAGRKRPPGGVRFR